MGGGSSTAPNWMGHFCVCCALFASARERKNMVVMVNAPFRKCHHKSDVITKHLNKHSHVTAVKGAELFIQSVDNPTSTIPIMTDKRKAANITENHHILKSVAEVVLYSGCQCIALCGDHEQLDTLGNPGNFLALMKMMANHDEKLKNHMDMPQLLSATYLPSQTQNKMVDIIDNRMIQDKIIEEVKKARVYTVMVDEVTSHNVKLMPVCVRFVDKDLNVREELLEICSLPRITGLHIANKLRDVPSQLGLDIRDCQGQAYDEASNMSSDRVGVQALIRQDSPKAVYMHCNDHSLNLVIAHPCALPMVCNTLDKMKSAVSFFIYSPKRESLLREVAAKDGHPMGLQKPLIDVHCTRWVASQDAYSHFAFIVKALKVIAHGLHTEVYSVDITAGWEAKYRMEASNLLSGIEKFEFIITFLTVYQYLSHMAGIIVKLQSTSIDIMQAFNMVEEVKDVYKNLQETIAIDFAKIYDQTIKMAATIDVEPAKPRTASRMQNRTNAPAETVQEYCLHNVAVPFIDHVITEMEARFSPLALTSSKLLGLVPLVLCSQEMDITAAVDMYQDNLPSPELIDQELKCWKLKWMGKSTEQTLSSCVQAIKECDTQQYPKISQLLKLACTLPVTSCECELSASNFM